MKICLYYIARIEQRKWEIISIMGLIFLSIVILICDINNHDVMTSYKRYVIRTLVSSKVGTYCCELDLEKSPTLGDSSNFYKLKLPTARYTVH